MWLGKLTVLDMTQLGWLGPKTSTQKTYMYMSIPFQILRNCPSKVFNIIHIFDI